MLPEDVFDRQPVRGARFVTVADGRLDNRAEVASALDVRSADLELLSDSDLIARAVETWAEAAFNRLIGVFAVASWDHVTHRLILARDILGHRPLFYHVGLSIFAFATTPAGLHALPEVPRAPDQTAVAEFVSLVGLTGSRTYFENVERVLPGHYCIVEKGRVRSERYWHPSTVPLRLKKPEDYVFAMRSHLETAVAAQIRGAEAHVGAHLSSGLDSSAVASTAAKLLSATGGRVTAFTGAPREGYVAPHSKGLTDESPFAAATAAMHPNMDHVIVRSDAGSPLNGLDNDVNIFGQPLTNLCNLVWVQTLTEAARRAGVRTMLIGVFGNASLSYSGVGALPELFQSGAFIDWMRLARALVRRREMRWRGVLLNTLFPLLPRPLLAGLRALPLPLPKAVDRLRYTALPAHLYPDLHAAAVNDTSALISREYALSGEPYRNGLHARLSYYGLDVGPLDKGVLALWDVDHRDPTADRRLVEFSLTIPTEIFMYEGRPKGLIKSVLADRVPAEVLNNPLRGEQGANWHEGLDREQIAGEVERIAEFAKSEEFIDIQRLRRLVDDWPEQGWDAPEVAVNYRYALLRGISAAHFVRRAAGSNI